MSTYQQNPDGSWAEAQPIGWREEHGWLARLWFWLRHVEHCPSADDRRREVSR